MKRTLFTPSTCPATPVVSPLLLFIQQAQLSIVYSTPR
jgi:hypothetical protein